MVVSKVVNSLQDDQMLIPDLAGSALLYGCVLHEVSSSLTRP